MGFMDGFERGLSGNYRYEIAGKAVVLSLIHISEPTRPY